MLTSYNWIAGCQYYLINSRDSVFDASERDPVEVERSLADHHRQIRYRDRLAEAARHQPELIIMTISSTGCLEKHIAYRQHHIYLKLIRSYNRWVCPIQAPRLDVAVLINVIFFPFLPFFPPPLPETFVWPSGSSSTPPTSATSLSCWSRRSRSQSCNQPSS